MNDKLLINILLVLVAIMLPPLAVAIKRRGIDNALWINLALTLLAYFPGLAHAVWIIFKKG